MFEELERIGGRPGPFEFYTAGDLWTDEHTSAQMLACHLDGTVDVSSRNTEFIDRSVEWIVSRFGLGRDSKVADFGCGPGLYALRLARLGAKVTGIDFSGRSLEYAWKAAAREHLDIDYVQGNYLDFETVERFDLVTMIMCDYCALGPEQRTRMLRKFHGMLRPGGSVLLDAYSLAAFGRIQEAASYEHFPGGGFWSPHRHHVFLHTFRYDEEKVSLDKFTIVEPERTRTVYNWLQYFSSGDLEREFGDEGLSVVELLSDVTGAPYSPDSDEFAVIATKA